MSRKLLLFDIDGTLLNAHGIGARLFREVLSRECGRPIASSGIVFSGRTDPQIMYDILDRAGYPRSEAIQITARALKAYTQRARQVVRPSAITTLPGVASMLQTLHVHYDVRLGLLTGNVEETAFGKVHAVGLGQYFDFGAFGSDSEDRQKLPAVALGRAQAKDGVRYTPADCVIIGDSPLDIACARSADMLSVAVATGVHSRQDLQAHLPDLLLSDFADPQPFIDGVLLTQRPIP